MKCERNKGISNNAWIYGERFYICEKSQEFCKECICKKCVCVENCAVISEIGKSACKYYTNVSRYVFERMDDEDIKEFMKIAKKAKKEEAVD